MQPEPIELDTSFHPGSKDVLSCLMIFQKGFPQGPALRLRPPFNQISTIFNRPTLGLARYGTDVCFLERHTLLGFPEDSLTGQLILAVFEDPKLHPVLIDHLLDSEDSFVVSFLTKFLLKPFSPEDEVFHVA